MSLVFNCNMPELKTDDGKTVPDTTAKFVLLALADNANDEGEGSYPGVDTLCKKTNYSTATVCNALNALRHNGFTELVGKSKYDTNNYTVLAAKISGFQWLKRDDFSGYNPTTLAAKTNPSVKPLVKPIYIDPVISHMQSIGMWPNSNTGIMLTEWRAKHTDSWIIAALDRSKGKNQNYADKILLGWEAAGYPKSRDEQVRDRKQYAPTQPAKPSERMGTYVPD